MTYRSAATGQFVTADEAAADPAGTIEDGEVIITITDIREAGHCVRGVKDWFEQHDLNFKAFLRDGIDAKTFVGTGDSLAQMVVDLKMERERGESISR